MDKEGWPFGDSEMHRLVRAHDWAATPLGRVRRWPAQLKHATEIMLASPFPAVILWGPGSIQIYNDRHIGFLGDRHPAALGRPVLETWPEFAGEIDQAYAALQAAGTVDYANWRFEPTSAGGAPVSRLLTGGWSAIRDRRGTILGVLVSYADTSSQARAEEALRGSETRHAFLLALGDAIRPLSDALEIQGAATGLLRARLGADRVSYLEADGMDGFRVTAGSAAPTLPPAIGHPWLFLAGPGSPEALHQGVMTWCDDVQTHAGLNAVQRKGLAALGIEAGAAAPLIRAGRLVGILAAAFSRPHAWTVQELDLLRETADRTWDAAQCARAEKALRASEERFDRLLESTDEIVSIVDRNGRYVYRNSAAMRFVVELGMHPDHGLGQAPMEAFPDLRGSPAETAVRQVFERREPAVAEFAFSPTGREYRARLFPMPDGGVSIFVADVTERNAVVRQARDSAERQAFLLGLSDALRPLADPEAIKAEAARVLGARLAANRVGYSEALPDGERVEITRHFVDGLESIAGVYRLSDYGADFAKAIAVGRVSVRNDLTHEASLTDPERKNVRSLALGAAVSLPLMKAGRLVAILFVHSRATRTWSPLELDLMQETVERTWDAVQRARAERALAESEARFRLFADASEDVLWIRNVETNRYEYASAGFRTVFGLPAEADPVGATLDDLLARIHPDDVEATRASIAQAVEGEPQVLAYRFLTSGEDFRWIRSAIFPIRDPAGRISHVGGISQNVTEERRAAERMSVMIGELQHRTRNLLAVVRSIAEQTMALTGPTPAFQEKFGERLAALSRAQGLLARADREPITIEALVRTELDALGADGALAGRIRLAGPPARVRNRHVQTLALALHELATNARKYGALSNGGGRLDVVWSFDADRRRLVLEWSERVGTPLKSPADVCSGYGRMLIERALPYALGAETAYTIDSDGVRCTIALPLDSANDREEGR